MAQHQDNARERVLDAFEDELVARGDAQATLDAVAARAGLTKGGLLYHFGSRAALVAGLLGRFATRTRDDLDVMRTTAEGAAANYLQVDDYLLSPLHRTTLAVSQLADREPSAVEALGRARDDEIAVLTDELGDPDLARVVVLFAEGLYARALTRPDAARENASVIAWFVANVLDGR